MSVGAGDSHEDPFEDDHQEDDHPIFDVASSNGPNPWLPAYGFQLQHPSHFQCQSVDDARVNDGVLVQQVDFLETILEETSDDLQSDSDRSGTTYWLGSDSETESVIHIRSKQRSTEKLDGSGSECNSVVPKKRRRRNNGSSSDNRSSYEDYPVSPRSSRSSESSRSSSLVQFESLERTCATLSPSSYSFDSLEYSNRSNNSHLENTSPDSLEEYDRLVPNGYPESPDFPKIRPYRSFESLESRKDQDYHHVPNGFSTLYLKTSSDLSKAGKVNRCPRDFWHEEDYDDEEEGDDEVFGAEEDEEDQRLQQNRVLSDNRTVFEDREYMLDCGSYSTSLDYRNTIDLREIGIESSTDARSSTLLDLKSSQSVSSSQRLLARINLAGNNMAEYRHRHHHHRHESDEEGSFNFRYTDKSQSAPSLPGSVEESAARRSSSRPTSLQSHFENYTRVSSVPVDLNLCGNCTEESPRDARKNMTDLKQIYDEKPLEGPCASLKSVRTQAAQSTMAENRSSPLNGFEDEESEESEEEAVNSRKTTSSTVKTQDSGNVLQMVMENDIDAAVGAAIEQLKREVEEGTSNPILFVDNLEKGLRQQRRVKNNASYELAQQYAVDEGNFAGRLPVDSKMARKRVSNNASYELAQQVDYIKVLQPQRTAFQRMDACDELEEERYHQATFTPQPKPIQQPPKEDSLFDQIKKNSDLFSIYGEGVSSRALLDDEVDYPCLETKPIDVLRESKMLDSKVEGERSSSEESRRSFIGEFYPELQKQTSGEALGSEENRSGEVSGERLWRVLAERGEGEGRAALEGVGRGSVHGGPPPASPLLLEDGASGKNPALAVDSTGRREADGGERSVSAMNAMSTSPVTRLQPKRSFLGPRRASPAPQKTTDVHRTVPGTTTPTIAKNEERKKSGLGGFLQRFSKLRFSGRSKVPRSEVQKNSSVESQVVNRGRDENRRKEPDYIIIPLHPPESETRRTDEDVFHEACQDLQRSSSSVGCTTRAPVSKKPPLPPGAPRTLSGGTGSGVCVAGGAAGGSRRRATTDLGHPLVIEMAKARAMQAAQERPVGLLETDLDEAVPANDVDAKKTRSLLNLNHSLNLAIPNSRAELSLHVPQSPNAIDRNNPQTQPSSINHRPHKSMEFLLDKENLHFVKPPENELQKVGERVPSEHELRVQRSLQRLNVPDWYKNSPAARDGFRLKRHSDASQHGGWRALGSKTTSLSSLSSSSNRQPSTGALLSPSPTPPVFSRWSTSLLNSAGSSPASSARSSFNHRQPYLGWRSQERLTNPRTPAERLAQGILPQLQSKQQQQQQQTTNQQLEVRNSIKEVTSAIVHYVQCGQEATSGRLSPRPDNWDDRGGARSTSPRGSGKLCWMESSFVGTKPMDSPETPMSLTTDPECCVTCNATDGCSCANSTTSGLFLDLTPSREDGQLLTGGSISSLCPSPSSTSNYHPNRRQHHHQPPPPHPHHHHQHHHQHHHHQRQHQQQTQQQHRHHRGTEKGKKKKLEKKLGWSDTEEMDEVEVATATAALLRNKPSPGSTTLEDVLDSLLGLPSASRTPSPGPPPVLTSARIIQSGQAKPGKSCGDLRQNLQESARSVMDMQSTGDDSKASYYVGELVRRKSEGSDTILAPTSARGLQSNGNSSFRHRVSFDDSTGSNGNKAIRCRNNKCSNSATLTEARKLYKSCHNCTCLYCSRECRRAHWERHRKTCLHFRAGSLCKQVLSSAKEDPTTLKHISALARRGFASDGRGAVRCFFSCPEAAEKFIQQGFVELGEPTYIRWADLLPTEMGPELFAEVIRLCENYNPETRLVLYVAICVVSEVPTRGAVRWERQLVSKCAKMRLDGAPRQTPVPAAPLSATSPQNRHHSTASPCNITREMDSPETLILTSLPPAAEGQNTSKKIREISFGNIQKQLRLRGVSLRRHFPQVYKKLCSYVDGSVDKFAPVTIYPRDQASGKSFMCIIMLDAEPERLQLLPTDSSRVRTVDISVDQE
ncbi:uncharacterized protein [Prorops nasuta]|uniref:uncharacterized protein isoform X2 n=1 Tax=Prorops nasuta TaxID=863751 RepID=UPI0034CD92E2